MQCNGLARAATSTACLLLSLLAACGLRETAAAPSPSPTAELSRAEACATPAPNQPGIPWSGNSLVPICRDMYVDADTTPEERERLKAGYGAAIQHVARALGPLRAEPPVAIFCKSDPCRVYFAGPARRSWIVSPHRRVPGAAYVAGDRVTIVIVRADPGAHRVAAHEMVHVELLFRVRRRFVPQWFHEGIAASIGNEPRCKGQTAKGIDDLRRLDRNRAWADHTNRPGLLRPTYCQARGEVQAWVGRFGKDRLLSLLRSVGDGASFYDLYGPLLTQ